MVAATALVAASLAVLPTSPAAAAVTCSVSYTSAWSNGSQFGANVVITNSGDAVNGWSLVFNFPNSATVSNGWPVSFTQSGTQVTIASNADWNKQIPSGGTFTAGFNANGVYATPASFSLNGVTCGGGGGGQQSLVVSPTAVTVAEGGTATYGVHLQSQPSSNVTVTTTAGSGDADLTVSSGASLTFTTANWNTNQNVTLAAAQDADTTNGTRPFTVASAGLTSVTVTATEADDDTAQQQAVVLSASTLSVPEGGTAQVTARLAVQPSGNVTVTGTAGSGDSNLTVSSGGTLTFTSANWNTPQAVTIAAAEDADTTNGSRTFTFSATGATSATLTATEADNDVAQQQSLVVTPTAVAVPEGSTASFAVHLAVQPSANVTVTTTAGSGDSNLTVSSGASLTFTTANWNTNQSVTLAAAQDADTTNGTRPFTVASSGLTSVTVTATEVDDDVPVGQKVDNPYSGATGYVNPDWKAEVLAEADARTGSLATQMRNVADTSTAVWMDRIGAITAGRGLAGHLDAAVAQDAANGSAPVVITIVIYDLPNRDCAALASNGELLIADGGMARYQSEYITPIKNILSQPAYANLRISLIMEVDSLPNLVTNLSISKCSEANQAGGYVDGVRYAINQLAPLSNTYLYMDIAHSGWLGWPDNFSGILQVMDRTLATGQGGPGYDKIAGFITNTANYTPTQEIFMPNPQLQVGSGQIMSANFYEFNPRIDEKTFATNLQAEFQNRGCNAPNTCGMLIDTSRNGWGGPNRPTAVSTSTDLNTYVNASRIDRRPHRGDWCNQNGAGMGVRPTANTGIAGVDAFVWVKPPGESDGVSQAGVIDPDDPAKGFDAMCDPTAQNRYDSDYGTNALPNAPHAGRWFPAEFAMLVQNAYPAIPTS